MQRLDRHAGNFRSLGPPVLADHAGQRLDAYLAELFPFLSRAGWQERIKSGELLIDDRVVRAAYRLKPGERVSMFHPLTDEPEVDENIRVLYEESGVLAVYKPGNLPMHENGPYRKNTLATLLHTKIGREWSAVHRLDRETSGIVLCAATSTLRERLARALFEKRVIKEYLAIGRGTPAQPSWLVDGPIDKLEGSAIRIKKWVVAGGLSAQTDFHVVERCSGYVLLRAMPRTGRTNQIRIHAAYSGLPLVGDKLYHPDEQVFLDYFEDGNSASVQARAGFHRHCLHAAALTFEHPDLKIMRAVQCPLPDDMAMLWQTLSTRESVVLAPIGCGAVAQPMEVQANRT